MKRLRRVSIVLLASLGLGLVVATPAHAERLGTRPNWGACGTSTSETKNVYSFGSIILKCGNSSWGYRHIKSRHMSQFQTLAAAGGLNWSDLVHWAIHYNVQDPDHVAVDQNTGCRDRVLFLHDRNGRLVWQQRFRLTYNAVDGRVITVHPDSRICEL
jgi:hypothetical protein